jgi:hypothetical protein
MLFACQECETEIETQQEQLHSDGCACSDLLNSVRLSDKFSDSD